MLTFGIPISRDMQQKASEHLREAAHVSLTGHHPLIVSFDAVAGLAARVFFTVLALLRSAFLWPEVFFIALTSVAKVCPMSACCWPDACNWHTLPHVCWLLCQNMEGM